MRTVMVGKSHLGGLSPHLPTDFGFGTYIGALHSNDMHPFQVWRAEGGTWSLASPQPAQEELTRMYTNESIHQLELAASSNEATGARTFLFVSYHAPHDPLHVSAERAGASSAGLYGDVVEELDHSVGRLLSTLDRLRMRTDTLVILSSDNGPWYEGGTGGLRGRKAGAFEGGFRVPLIVSWPGGGLGEPRWLHTPSHATDVFASILAACGLSPPSDRAIDGENMLRLWREPPASACEADDASEGREEKGLGAPNGGARPECQRAIYLHNSVWLVGVRRGAFKLHLPHLILPDQLVRSRFLGDHDDGRSHLWLSNLEADPEESFDASAARPREVGDLAAVADSFTQAFDGNPRGWKPI
jgi:arylsulfatase A-like enzyme